MSTSEEDRELYAELVLQCAESVPRGRVTTYGAIADVVGTYGEQMADDIWVLSVASRLLRPFGADVVAPLPSRTAFELLGP